MPVLRSVGSSPTVSTKISEGRISVASMAEGRRASSYCEAGIVTPTEMVRLLIGHGCKTVA